MSSMYTLQPLPQGARKIAGVGVWEFLTGRIKYNIRNPLILIRSLRQQFGEIFKVQVFHEGLIFLASQRMVAPLLSKSDCEKVTHSFLEELRAGDGEDGLFTMYNDEPDWSKAHRILVPAFGSMSVRNMYDGMADILSSLLLRWSAHEGTVIDLPNQLTRLTLDTIALCSFNYRFNSFYQHEMHPFVQDMIEFLTMSANRGLEPIFRPVRYDWKMRWNASRKRMGLFAEEVLRERRNGDSDTEDLCRRMLDLADPETGEKLSDKNIRAQLLTFLVAGHETTSGLLSFCLYFLMTNPEAMHKAQAEVDALGTITRDAITKLTYIEACLKEALRLEPTAPMFSVKSKTETVLADGYILPANQEVMIDLHGLHTDANVYPDPLSFKPERMLGENFDALPPHSWKPFGNGVRACIGRAFAMQESILAIACIVQNFDLQLANPNYRFRVKFTLTIKPANLQVILRKRRHGVLKLPLLTTMKPSTFSSLETDERGDEEKTMSGKPALTILFGSEAGSSRALAKEVQTEAQSRGYLVSMNTLNSCQQLPTSRPVIILTASYDGQPTTNAKQFVEALRSNKMNCNGVIYALFGIGHHEWVDTYQAVPRLVDKLLLGAGAKPIIDRGEGDVATDFFSTFQKWMADLFKAITTAHETMPISNDESSIILDDSSYKLLPKMSLSTTELNLVKMKVSRSCNLGPEVGKGIQKRHLELDLPTSVTYETGDYLEVKPVNSEKNVLAILAHFKLDRDTVITIDDKAIAAHKYLKYDVEITSSVPTWLYGPLSRLCTNEADAVIIRNMKSKAADGTTTPSLSRAMTSKSGSTYLPLLSIIQQCPSCSITFTQFLSCFDTIDTRRYSISSRANSSTLSLTYSVTGLCTSYMSQLKAGDEVLCHVRQSAFKLPSSTTPILMFAVGTGIAPFRGFIQERHQQLIQGSRVGSTILFYGSRSTEDSLYHAELQNLASESGGVIEIRACLSGESSNRYRHVQDLIADSRETIFSLLEDGAFMYVCGGIRFAEDLRKLWTSMAAESREHGCEHDLLGICQSDRYKVDVFG